MHAEHKTKEGLVLHSICAQISLNLVFVNVKGSTSFGIFVNTDRNIPELRPDSLFKLMVEGDLGTRPL